MDCGIPTQAAHDKVTGRTERTNRGTTDSSPARTGFPSSLLSFSVCPGPYQTPATSLLRPHSNGRGPSARARQRSRCHGHSSEVDQVLQDSARADAPSEAPSFTCQTQSSGRDHRLFCSAMMICPNCPMPPQFPVSSSHRARLLQSLFSCVSGNAVSIGSAMDFERGQLSFGGGLRRQKVVCRQGDWRLDQVAAIVPGARGCSRGWSKMLPVSRRRLETRKPTDLAAGRSPCSGQCTSSCPEY